MIVADTRSFVFSLQKRVESDINISDYSHIFFLCYTFSIAQFWMYKYPEIFDETNFAVRFLSNWLKADSFSNILCVNTQVQSCRWFKCWFEINNSLTFYKKKFSAAEKKSCAKSVVVNWLQNVFQIPPKVCLPFISKYKLFLLLIFWIN